LTLTRLQQAHSLTASVFSGSR